MNLPRFRVEVQMSGAARWSPRLLARLEDAGVRVRSEGQFHGSLSLVYTEAHCRSADQALSDFCGLLRRLGVRTGTMMQAVVLSY